MTAANVINFILYWKTIYNYFETSAGNGSEITHAISVIVLSRMMLHIMEAPEPHANTFDDENEKCCGRRESGPNITTMHFASRFSVIANGHLGRSIQLPLEPVSEDKLVGRAPASST